MGRDEETLVDIMRACRMVLQFTDGLGQDRFMEDAKTQSAVVHQLLVLGEAVKRLSPAFREAHRDVPWTAMAGMRDKLIHAYDEVDLDEVWRTVSEDIPAILRRLEPLPPSDDEKPKEFE